MTNNPPNRGHKSAGCLVLIAIVGTLAVVIFAAGGQGGGSAAKAPCSGATYQATAIVDARRHVRERLKYVSESDFVKELAEQKAGCTWLVNGTVNARNSLGGIKRVDYYIQLTLKQDGSPSTIDKTLVGED